MLAKKRIGGENQRVWIGISVKEEPGQVWQVGQVFLSSKKCELIEENKVVISDGIEELAPSAPVAPTSLSYNGEPLNSKQSPTLYRLKNPEMFPVEKCFQCGAKPIVFQVNYPDGSWGFYARNAPVNFPRITHF